MIFDGKKVLVTGAGQGIGRAVAVRLDTLGAKVVGLSKTRENLETLLTECPGSEIICCDVTDLSEVRKQLEPHMPFDMLVNNAGYSKFSSFFEITREFYDKIMDVNLKAPLFIAQTVGQSMVENKIKGSIVHVSSQTSKFAIPGHSVYGCSKAGLDMLCKNMALELGPHGIRVNCVNPTIVWTSMTLGNKWKEDPKKLESLLSKMPLGKVADIDDVVNAVVFLLSDKSAMTTGSTLMVDGGRTCT